MKINVKYIESEYKLVKWLYSHEDFIFRGITRLKIYVGEK